MIYVKLWLPFSLLITQIQGRLAVNNEEERANGPPVFGDVVIQMETRDGLSSFLLQVKVKCFNEVNSIAFIYCTVVSNDT